MQAILNNRHIKVLGMTPFQAMFGREMLDPFDLAMRSSFSEDLKMFISPAEWHALRAQQNKVRRERADKLFASRKKKVEAKAGARAGWVAQVGDLVLLRVDARYASGRFAWWL